MKEKMTKEMLEKVLDSPIFNSAVWGYYKSQKVIEDRKDELEYLAKTNTPEHTFGSPMLRATFHKSSFLVTPNNRSVKDWEKSDEQKKHRKHIADKLIEYYLNEDFTVMELISQTGEIATAIAPHVKAVDCYEWSDDAMKGAREESVGVNNVEIYDMRLRQIRLGTKNPRKAFGFDLKRLPTFGYIEKKYDFIYSHNAFKFFDIYETYHFLNKASNLLRPDGKMWINLHFDNSLEEHRATFLEQYGFYEGDIYDNHGTNIQFINKKAFVWICGLCGLDVEDTSEWGECTLVKREKRG